MVRVNFDPLIVRLLREVKYFLLLGLRVPESAFEVFSRGEVRPRGNIFFHGDICYGEGGTVSCFGGC